MDTYNKYLSMAAHRGKLDIVKFLVGHGVDAEIRAENGQPSASNTAMSGGLEVVKFLACASADIETKDEDGQTPLLMAVDNGRSNVVKFLKEVIVQDRPAVVADVGNLTKSASPR